MDLKSVSPAARNGEARQEPEKRPVNTSALAKTQLSDPVLAEHAAAIRALGKRVVGDVTEIGARLTECKRIAGHGNWLPWLKREFGWTEMTAVRFMQVHEMTAKSNNLLDIDLPVSSLYLLAAPSTPDIARDTVLDLAANGEKLTHDKVKEMIAQARRDEADGTERERQKVVHCSIQAWKALAELDRRRIITEASGNSQFNAQSNELDRMGALVVESDYRLSARLRILLRARYRRPVLPARV